MVCKHPVKEMATPMTHDAESNHSARGVYSACAETSASPDSHPTASIGAMESALVYSVGPHSDLNPRWGPTMCLP